MDFHANQSKLRLNDRYYLIFLKITGITNPISKETIAIPEIKGILLDERKLEEERGVWLELVVPEEEG